MTARTDGRRAAGEQTRRALVEAATRLLAADGEPGVTLRALSAESGANVAAVKYHFGSREALVAEVVEAAVRPVVDAQVTALRDVPPGAAAEAWIEAWARPLIRVAIGARPADREVGRIIAQTLAAPSATLDVRVRDLAGEASERLLEGLAGALPGVDASELPLRLALMASALAGIAGGSYAPFLDRADPTRGLEDRIFDRLLRIAT
jgi:AcrR family transcriptional regulator